MKIVCLSLFVIICFSGYSQIKYEKGRFITNDGKVVDCLIKNVDWAYNPTKFEYKLTEDSEVITASIDDIEEFEIIGDSKYKRYTVQVDMSKDKTSELSTQRSPEFAEKTLFLKVLIEGKATLLRLEGNYGVRFFYKFDSTQVEPLINKRYLLNNYISSNEYYKQQLWTNLKCSSFQKSKAETTMYTKKSLTQYFTDYNTCHGSLAKTEMKINKPKRKCDFNLHLRAGVNFTSFTVTNSLSSFLSADFGNQISPRIAAELEFILPLNKDKWSVLLEPGYQSFKGETTTSATIIPTKVSVNYNSLEFPIGLRYYFLLNSNSKLFLNALSVFNLTLESNIKYSGSSWEDQELKSTVNYAFGAGYNFKNRYSLEIRYLTNRDLFSGYRYFTNKYQTTSIILGYRLF